MSVAFITGITGQDGSYLTELLLEKGYKVHGLVRRTSNTVRLRLESLVNDPEIYNRRLFLHYGDLDDPTTTRRILQRVEPTELYHLAGQSHVGLSFEIPESTCELTAMGTLRLLEIIRDLTVRPKVLHSSSSEIFGNPSSHPQSELTPFNPVTPYGVAKTFATQMASIYRECYGLFISNMICYNHESPRRGESFVTRKITRGAARIRQGRQEQIALGNLDACRDWGAAPDYVEAMWLALQQDSPEDYVVASGVAHSVRDFLERAFSYVGLDWRQHVAIDSRFYRPNDVGTLVGDASRAREKLGWRPNRDFRALVEWMVESDLRCEAEVATL